MNYEALDKIFLAGKEYLKTNDWEEKDSTLEIWVHYEHSFPHEMYLPDAIVFQIRMDDILLEETEALCLK